MISSMAFEAGLSLLNDIFPYQDDDDEPQGWTSFLDLKRVSSCVVISECFQGLLSAAVYEERRIWMEYLFRHDH